MTLEIYKSGELVFRYLRVLTFAVDSYGMMSVKHMVDEAHEAIVNFNFHEYDEVKLIWV